MEDFKLVKEDSYESLFNYLNLLYQIFDMEYPLAWVDIDDDKYLMTKVSNDDGVDNTYALAYSKDFLYGLYGVYYDDETFTFNDGRYGYRIEEDGVCVEDLTNGFKQELVYSKTVETNPKDIYTYIQADKFNGRRIDLNYIINGHENINMTLPYLGVRTADHITLETKKLLLKKLRRYALESDKYYRYLRLNNDAIVLIPRVDIYNIDEMKEYLRTLGFLTSVPKILTDLYSDNYKEANHIKRAIKTYKRNTNL